MQCYTVLNILGKEDKSHRISSHGQPIPSSVSYNSSIIKQTTVEDNVKVFVSVQAGPILTLSFQRFAIVIELDHQLIKLSFHLLKYFHT